MIIIIIIIPVPYGTVGTAQIFKAWNTFPAFSFDLGADLTRLKHSVFNK